jgi:hypothetical protein
MANKKITDLVEITSAADVDVLAIVDVSADTTNKIKVDNLPVSAPVQTALDAKQATLVSGTNIKTINSTSLLGSGDIAIAANPAGTAGQIQFSDGSAFAADSNLFWDNTNKRLGVGTSSPSYGLDVSQDINGNLFARLRNTNASGFGMQLNAGSGLSTYTLQWANFVGAGGGRLYPDGVSIGQQSVPSARLHIKGSGSTSATTSLLVQNSSGTDLLKVDDSNQVVFNNSTLQAVNTVSSESILRLDSAGSIGVIRMQGNQIGMGNNSTGDASALLTLTATTKGFLPPRMTTTQKNAISTPAAGLQLYDSTTSRPCVYTTAWESLTSSDSASPTAVYKFWSGTAAQYAALTPDANTVYFVS